MGKSIKDGVVNMKFKIVDYVESPLGSKKGLVLQKEKEVLLINFKGIPIEVYDLKIRKGEISKEG